MDNNTFTKKGNIFKIKVITFERLKNILINNGFNPEEVDQNGLTYYKSKEARINLNDLDQVLYSLAEENNLFEENALFHQLMLIKNKELTNDKNYPNVLDEIIYIDFTSKDSNMLQNYAKHIQVLFAQGFDVYEDNKIKYHFVPFDKSSSMGRQSRISFISTIGYDANGVIIDNFYEIVRKRAYLDLLEEKVEGVALSKRYAYRGLMLSGGRRITLEEINKYGLLSDFCFNKKTVLLVQDWDEEVRDGIHYFTQKIDDRETTNQEENKELNKKLKFVLADPETTVTNNTKKTINDGYGFIASELADSIDKSFRGDNVNKRIKKHCSYQVRFPYVKGVVHRIDFKQFFRENQVDGKIKIRTYDENLNPCTKEFKIEDLENIQMVISESMFKVYKELRQFKKNNPDIGDAMDFYFKKLNEYQHSLFVLTMDKPDGRIEEETTWNYQYISTVDLSHEEFKSIYQQSKDKYVKLKTDSDYQREYIIKKFSDNMNDSDGIDSDDFNSTKKYSLERKILNKNKDFIYEPYFKNIISDEASSIKNYFAIGRLFIDGHDRFLVGDPIKYLYRIVNQECPEEEKLPENSFYVPGVKKDGKENKEYPVLRNPHLSRNEDLTLKIFFPKEDSIRHQYLKDLTGACIIDPSHSSLPADTVGGADYDGDHVKIYFNDTYSAAINKNRKDGNEDGYPLVINDDYTKGNKRPEDYIDNAYNKYLVNMQTFNNFVGEISNLAFKESLKAYSSDTEKGKVEEYKDNVRLLGILTGVEVDSAKTGIKPQYKGIVNAVRNNKIKDPSNYFIDFKAMREGSKTKKQIEEKFISNEKSKDKGNDEKKGKAYFKSIYEESDYDLFSKTFKENTTRHPSNVETLIQEFNDIDLIKSDDKTTKLKRKKGKRSKNLFAWEENLEEFRNKNNSELGQINNIIKAYFKICNEKNYLLHSDNLEDKGGYYYSLVFRAANYDEEKGLYVLDNLLIDLANIEKVPYIDFNNLFNACTNSNLVYYYYPYFSNPYKDSINEARKWLINKFETYLDQTKIQITSDQLDFLLSDAMNIHYVLYNVRNRRYKNYENLLSNEDIEKMTKLISKDCDEEAVNTFFIELENSYKNITKYIIEDCLGKSREEDTQELINFRRFILDNKKKMKKHIVDCLKTIYKKECLDLDEKQFKDVIEECVEKLIEKLKEELDKNNIYCYWDLVNSDEIKKKIFEGRIQKIYYKLFSKNCSSELTKMANNYRITLRDDESKALIKVYNELKEDVMNNNNVYWKSTLNASAIKKIKTILTKDGMISFTDKELEILMIKYARAAEKDVDKDQKFLFNCLGTIMIKYIRERKKTND